MRAAVYHGPGDIRIENVPDPKIEQPTDAIVRITHSAICGSDLWFYRGADRTPKTSRSRSSAERSRKRDFNPDLDRRQK